MKHEFVEFIPSKPEEGIVYISIEYKTATHLCACGCGQKVITPISPINWKLTFDGDSITLRPSIGNWRFPCKSHYFITKNKIVWAEQWTDEEIEACQKAERKTEEAYYKMEPSKKPKLGEQSSNTLTLIGWLKHKISNLINKV